MWIKKRNEENLVQLHSENDCMRTNHERDVRNKKRETHCINNKITVEVSQSIRIDVSIPYYNIDDTNTTATK